MKKNYILFYVFTLLIVVFSSCTRDEEQLTTEPMKMAEEPEFVKNDGSEGLEGIEANTEEELAPDLAAKCYYNYTLLTPSDKKQPDVDALKCGESITMPLLVGSTKKRVGKVVVSNDGENLYLTFRANQERYMKKIYLYIGEKQNIPFYSNGFPNLQAFNYKAFPYYFGGMKNATYVIPLSSVNLDCFEIVAYAKVYDKESGCFYSAFAYDSANTQQYTYSYYTGCYYYGEWVRSFNYCLQSCAPDCVQAYGYHEDCGICENDVLNTFLAYSFIDRNGEAGFDIELITNTNGCDIDNSTEVGIMNIAEAGPDKLKIEYNTIAGYAICQINFNYGSSRFNTPNNYSQQFDTPVTSYSFEIDRLSGANIYVDGGAMISEGN